MWGPYGGLLPGRQPLSWVNSSKQAREEPGYTGGSAGGKRKNVVQHREITADHKTQHLKLTITVFSYVWEDARVWAHWIYSPDMRLNHLGPGCYFSPFWIPSRYTVDGGYSGWLRRGIQDASCVGPGKSNLPLELRRKAGDCSRVTAGPIDLI